MEDIKSREIITEVFFGTLLIYVLLLATRLFNHQTGISYTDVVVWGTNFICMITALGLLCGSAKDKKELISLGVLSAVAFFVYYCVKIYIMYVCLDNSSLLYNTPFWLIIANIQLSAVAFWIVAVFRGVALRQENLEDNKNPRKEKEEFLIDY